MTTAPTRAFTRHASQHRSFVKVLALTLISGAAWATTDAWVLMIGFAVLHHWWPIIPSMGYLAALVLLLAYRVIFGARPTAKRTIRDKTGA